MNSEELFWQLGGADPELIARADKHAPPTKSYSGERKQQRIRWVKHFFVAAACLLFLSALVKLLN